MISPLPATTAPSGLWGVVQPQEDTADSMITGELLILVKAKSCVTGTPCLTFPKSKASSLNLIKSSAFFAGGVCAGEAGAGAGGVCAGGFCAKRFTDKSAAQANRNNFFICE